LNVKAATRNRVFIWEEKVAESVWGLKFSLDSIKKAKKKYTTTIKARRLNQGRLGDSGVSRVSAEGPGNRDIGVSSIGRYPDGYGFKDSS